MEISTYSFEDIDFTISHPSVGSCSANGEGLGDITVAWTNDRTAHDLAGDGSTMISKIRTHNGTITINVQQTSSLKRWLTKWFTHLDGAGAGEWADTTINFRASMMGIEITASGVSPQKHPDSSFKAQGGQVSWVLMAAVIHEQAI